MRYDPSNVCGMWSASVWGHFGGPSPENLLGGGGGRLLGNWLGGPSPPPPSCNGSRAQEHTVCQCESIL